MSPASSGGPGLGTEFVRKGRRISHGNGVVRDELGNRVAQGWGVFAVTGGKPT